MAWFRISSNGRRWMRLDCVREFYLRCILFVFSWDFCVVCYYILVKERLFCEMLLWWRIFCPSRDFAASEVELLVSRDSILFLFHVHFVVYMVDHAFQNASQCSGRSVGDFERWTKPSQFWSYVIIISGAASGQYFPDSSSFVLDVGPELKDESRFRDSRKDRQN